MGASRGSVALSIVAAAHNEQDNVGRLVEELHAVLEPTAIDYELIVVDDGSTDRTLEILQRVLPGQPRLRVIRLLDTPGLSGRGNGQAAAFHAGIRASTGALIALIDGDCQNDPTDIPPLVERLTAGGVDMVQGDRSADRRDSVVRRVSSWVGRFFRRLLLADTIRDTGCSLRVMRRAVALALPLEYCGAHRFIPFTARQLGYCVVEMPVHHRARTAGRTKYGIRNRAIPGLVDCFAMRWMRSRRRGVRYEEIAGERAADSRPAVVNQE
ncbi:MAG: glycosyltransferase family 2 protein [Planctomycetota bacterium]|jgi:glycosyltransferase involved in cell wall biosynthesis